MGSTRGARTKPMGAVADAVAMPKSSTHRLLGEMARLGLDFDSLGNIPIDERAPMVATRCAVFAKTDLSHLQQEGHTYQALYNGLCKGLVMSGLKSVFGGSIPKGKDLLLSGGLLANPHIRH